ncbi:unannotated protein [freshwater metagenome]|uniref:Unannotated protein n=1 Tax=freshwater metagenome TaxID=449393 RepID=A0A6J7P024_9ZZZZ|nr:hypothetical protein [Actinomycetota bacterium]
MQYYLALIAVILIANAMPAFAPPTWTILVFFLFNYDLHPAALVILGVLAASTGRGFLAWYFRKFARYVPTRFSKNMEYAGHYFQEGSGKKYSILALFLISPISSAQLFEAAGLMKTIALKPLLAAFALGRTISYTTYVTGAAAIAGSTVGDVFIHELKSPWAIATQIAMILGLVALGNIDWQRRLKQ